MFCHLLVARELSFSAFLSPKFLSPKSSPISSTTANPRKHRKQITPRTWVQSGNNWISSHTHGDIYILFIYVAVVSGFQASNISHAITALDL